MNSRKNLSISSLTFLSKIIKIRTNKSTKSIKRRIACLKKHIKIEFFLEQNFILNPFNVYLLDIVVITSSSSGNNQLCIVQDITASNK